MRRWPWPGLLVTWLALGSCGNAPAHTHGQRRGAIRPTDGTGWQNNGYGEVTVVHWDTPSGVFRLHYTREGGHAVPALDEDASGVPDFVERFGRIFDQVYQAEVETLRFRAPPSDETLHDRPDYGGDDRFDVYLQDRGGSSDGYIVTEACGPSGAPCAGYLVVENDFVGYRYPTPEDGMKVLASHEFFHAVQHAYVLDLDRTFSEGTATWATEQVFAEQSDFEGAIARFFEFSDRPLDDAVRSPSDRFPYATAIWPHFLAERFGMAILPAVFEALAGGLADSALDAVDLVLKRDHGSSLAAAFAEFALWNLLTGDRAVAAGGPGYPIAASLPQLPVEPVTQQHPYRLSGEIAYLSARYYRLAIDKDTRVEVTAEYEQPQLALHLVTGDPAAPTIVSGQPGQATVAIDSRGEVLLVAASTARRDKHLPLSLAVVGHALPPTDDHGDGDDDDAGVDEQPPASADGSGGCALGSTPSGTPWALGLIVLLALIRRRGAGAPRLVLALALVLLGCSDSSPTPTVDAGGSPDSMPVPDAAVDAQPDGPSGLALGDFVDFVADDQGLLSGQLTASEGQRFLLLLLSDDQTPLSSRDYVTLPEQQASARQPALDPAWAARPRPAAPFGPRHRCRFAQRLRDLLHSAQGPLAPPPQLVADAPPPELGDTRQFELWDAGGTRQTITAEAIRVDQTTVFWIDRTTEPAATIADEVLAEVAEGFSGVVLPRERIYFGEESDVDGDGLISVLLSPIVAQSAVAYVSPCDLIDPANVAACAVSNQMELLYLTPPNLLEGPYATPRALLEIMAHEFQHAIYFYRKYIRNQTIGEPENPYITEGLSHLAQDLSGHQAGNLYVVLATLDGIDLLAVPNLITNALTETADGEADGVMRGAGYLWLRYLFDQAGGDALGAEGQPIDRGGIAWLRGLIDQPELAEQSFAAASATPLEELTRQFWTAIALSNRGPEGGPLNDDPRFNFLPTTVDPITERQRGTTLFGSFHASQLIGPKTQSLAAADGKLRGGGAEFLLLPPVAAGQRELRFALQVATAARARGRLIRIE